MSRITITGLDEYFAEIANKIDCPKGDKMRWINNLKESVEDYLLDNPHATVADVSAQFGTPDELAQAYYDSLDSVELTEKMDKSRTRRRIVVIWTIVAAAIIGLFAIACVWMIIDNKNSQPVQITETVSDLGWIS